MTFPAPGRPAENSAGFDRLVNAVAERVQQAVADHGVLEPLTTATSSPTGATTDAALAEDPVPAVEAVAPHLRELLAPGRALLTGGKRLRAQLCGAGWLAAGGATSDPDGELPEALVLAGSALELFQATALIHDDVIDGSLTRRGAPAAHQSFATLHRNGGFLGNAASFGHAGAILLGDLLLAAASAEMRRAARAAGTMAGEAAHRIFDAMMIEVAFGQYLDVRAQEMPWQQDSGSDAVERALQVVRHKSARYSVEHPLALGAALAGGAPELLTALRSVGLPLGEAFQLRDDELGVFGDPEVTGKPAGDDLREGKRTVLLTLTLQRVSETERGLLQQRVGAPDLSLTEVEHMRDLMQRCGAVAEHERMIAARQVQGLDALRRTELSPASRAHLTALAEALVRRAF